MAAQAHAQALARATTDPDFSAAARHRIMITLVILAIVAGVVALSVYGVDYCRLPPVLRAGSPKHAVLRSGGWAGIRAGALGALGPGVLYLCAFRKKSARLGRIGRTKRESRYPGSRSGDSAIEAALGVSKGGRNRVTSAYRGDDVKRARERSQEMLAQREAEGLLRVLRNTQVREILADKVRLSVRNEILELPNDFVIVLIGGELPEDFLRKTGMEIVEKAVRA